MNHCWHPHSCRRQTAFTLVELLVVLAVIAILAGLLLPAVQVVRSKAQAIKCTSNIRQLGIGVMAYAGENDGFLPNTYNALATPAYRWSEQIAMYVEASGKDNGTASTSVRFTNTVLAGCPSYKPVAGYAVWDVGYGLNGMMNLPANNRSSDTRDIATNRYQVFNAAAVTSPSLRCLLLDCNSFAAQITVTEAAYGVRHQQRLNVLFFDLRVQPLQLNEALLSLTDPIKLSL